MPYLQKVNETRAVLPVSVETPVPGQPEKKTRPGIIRGGQGKQPEGGLCLTLAPSQGRDRLSRSNGDGVILFCGDFGGCKVFE
jgi:hypothetical protein